MSEAAQFPRPATPEPVTPEPDTPPTAPEDATGEDRKLTILAVTACPTGIAHTYMAAGALKYAAERAEVGLAVETQGSSATTALDPEVIAAADAVIFATDVGRFRRTPCPVPALLIMTLGAENGARVVVESEDQAALDKITAMVAEDLDAEQVPLSCAAAAPQRSRPRPG